MAVLQILQSQSRKEPIASSEINAGWVARLVDISAHNLLRLPAAMKTGNLTVRPWSIVTKILYDKDTKKATGVEVLDAETNKTYQYFAKIIFLNASTFNSAWILMNSATDIWPDGLGSSSGELGP